MKIIQIKESSCCYDVNCCGFILIDHTQITIWKQNNDFILIPIRMRCSAHINTQNTQKILWHFPIASICVNSVRVEYPSIIIKNATLQQIVKALTYIGNTIMCHWTPPFYTHFHEII